MPEDEHDLLVVQASDIAEAVLGVLDEERDFLDEAHRGRVFARSGSVGDHQVSVA